MRSLKAVFLLICIVNISVIQADITSLDIYLQTLTSSGEQVETRVDDVQNFVLTTKIVTLIHGFLGDRHMKIISNLTTAYLNRGYQVLLVEWQVSPIINYVAWRTKVGPAGKKCGQILKHFFTRFNIPLNKVHIVGHSLGAHVAGNIGKYFNNTLDHVTGLDPAGPLFQVNDADCLQPSDAAFVDVIHTDGDVLGEMDPHGQVDFYINFGKRSQPGCKSVFDVSCSHFRAVDLYTESVNNARNFPSIPCSLAGINSKSVNRCVSDTGSNRAVLQAAINTGVETKIVYMGEGVSRTASGIYYVPTSSTSPFGRGASTVI